jgi:transcriptional regulator GlxA family with amidase domain
MRAGILLWPGFTLLAFSGFVDALRLAADIGDRSRQILCRWEIMSPSRDLIEASCGVRVSPTAALLDAREFDYVVVVAGRTSRLEEAPAENLAYIRSAAAAGVALVGICTGPFVLATLGLLDGRRAAVANYHYREFTERFPRVNVVYDQLFCIDRDRITCAGGAASIDLAAHLVQQHCGSDRAIKISHTTIVDSLRRPNAAQRVMRDESDRIADPRVARAVSLMEQHVSRPISLRDIAEKLNTSERQLERAFRRTLSMPPSRYFRRLRLTHGRWLLVNTRSSISQIAFDCGFSDNSHFTRSFQEEFGVAPRQLRRQATD